MPQGKTGDHAAFLLEVQRDQLAVMLLRQALRLFYIQAQLLGIVCCVHHQECDQEHALVPALQVFQQLFGLAAVGGQVARDDVHIIPGTDSLFLFLDLHLVQVGDFPLHILDGGHLVDGLNVKGNNQAGFHGEEVRQAPVVQISGEDGEEADFSLLAAHAEGVLGPEVKARRGNEILGGKPGRSQPLPVELERCLRVHVEHVMHQLQPLPSVQRRGSNAQTLEVVQQINLNALQPGLGRLEIFRLDAVGNELGLGQTVIALGQLLLKHFSIFMPHIIEPVILIRDDDALLEGFRAGRQIEEGKLKVNGCVKVVQEITPALKDRGFIIVLRQLVVDVLELNGLGVVVVGDTADAVRPHPLIRDRVLRCMRAFLQVLLLAACHQRLQLFLFSPCQLDFFLFLCHEGSF